MGIGAGDVNGPAGAGAFSRLLGCPSKRGSVASRVGLLGLVPARAIVRPTTGVTGMVWQYLFDNELKQRRDIEALRDETAFRDADSMEKGRELAALRQTVDRLGLALEAVVRILEQRVGVTREEVVEAIQRIDLADGVEDGRMGPDATAKAPACPGCGRPVNPSRDRCVYCAAPLAAAGPVGSPYRGAEPSRQQARPRPTVACASCGAVVPLDETDMSAQGPVCARCSPLVND